SHRVASLGLAHPYEAMRDSILGQMAEYSTGASGNATEAECKDKPGIPLTRMARSPMVAEQALDSSASVPCRADCLGSILPSTNALDSSLHIMPHAASLYAAFLRRSILPSRYHRALLHSPCSRQASGRRDPRRWSGCIRRVPPRS